MPVVIGFPDIVEKSIYFSREFSAKNAGLNNRFRNMVDVLPSIRAHDCAAYIEQRFDEPLEDLCQTRTGLLKWASFLQLWYSNCGTALFTVLITFVLALQVAHGVIDLSQLVTVTGLLAQLSAPLSSFGALTRSIMQAAGAVQACDELLHDHREEQERMEPLEPGLDSRGKVILKPSKPFPPLPIAGSKSEGGEGLKVEDIVFKYAGSDVSVLKGLSFAAAPGTYVVLCGGSGSGKSTLLSLVMQQRMPGPDSGETITGNVSIDGHSLHAHSLASFKSQTAVVFQASMILAGQCDICFHQRIVKRLILVAACCWLIASIHSCCLQISYREISPSESRNTFTVYAQVGRFATTSALGAVLMMTWWRQRHGTRKFTMQSWQRRRDTILCWEVKDR
jgi:ABC-type multidrug transport system fused ATPase/permease subunit